MLRRCAVLMSVGMLAVSIGLAGCAKESSQRDAGGRTNAHEQDINAAQGTVAGQDELSGKVVDGVREVKVEAFRYGYKPDPIIVKKGEKVRLIASSADVEHGLGSKDLGIDLKLSPGEEKTAEFTPEKAGEFEIRCTVYCGPGHKDMHGAVRVID